jgi:3'-phosphoadenosine 5'-phosphosulfate sulfotransferase (PAPS reductase)/FAD synthetase
MTIDLKSFDWIVVNTSAGKDSQALMDYVVEHARTQGVLDRVLAVHCDLGRVEWEGTRELAEEHARHYGLRFEVVSRKQGDLMTHFRQRRESLDAKGKLDTPAFPGTGGRYCTSDHKTSQVKQLHTRLADETRAAGGPKCPKILDCLGLRAEESDSRAKRLAEKGELEFAKTKSSGRKEVWEWNPLSEWLEEAVWERIWAAGTRWHWAYDKGMERLSCVFCIYASRSDLAIAASLNRGLLEEYVQLERDCRSTFPVGGKFSLADIQAELEQGEKMAKNLLAGG